MEIVTTIAPFALALIMFGLGLGLTTTDFSRVLKNPKDFFVGFFSQLILLPIVALGLVFLLNLPTTIAVGLMIIAAAPGGVTSNILTKFANGDVALSVTLTAVTSLVSILTVPFVVINSANIIGVSISSDISIANVALKMALVVTVPVLFGMIIRKLFTNFILSKINLVDKLSGILFIIVFAAIYIEERNNILDYILQSGLAVLILNIVMMTLAFLIAKKYASGISQQKCIAIEGGLQNGTVAVFVATLIFDDVAFVVPTAAYALIQYITGFLFIALLRKSN
ncbi:MAG: bile acid:sodium symporter family protein [Candidatus Pelagibacter sp.]